MRDPEIIIIVGIGTGSLIAGFLSVFYWAFMKHRKKKACQRLFESASRGSLAKLVRALKDGADIHLRDEEGGTALIVAALHGNRDVVEFLVDQGVEIDAMDEPGWTALMIACHQGHSDVVRLLLEKKASQSVRDRQGKTALEWAMEKKHYEIVTLLKSYGTVREPDEDLVKGVLSGDLELVKKALVCGGNPGIRDDDNGNLLIRACQKGHREVAGFLISKGVSVNAKDNNGWTPLMIASHQGHRDLTEFLLSRGADAGARTNQGFSARDWAKRNRHREVLSVLERSASLDASRGRKSIGY